MQDQILQALRQNDTAQAVQLAQAWVHDEPGQAQAHRWLALALQQQGQPEAAQEPLQQALLLAPDDAQLHLQQAGLLLALHQFEGADEALLRTTDLNPNAFEAYLMQAHLAIGRNDIDTAARQATLAAKLQPEHPEVLALQGMVALYRDDADRALQLLSEAARQMPNDPRVLYALGSAYQAKDMLAFAEQAFRRVLDINPKMTSLHGLVVQLALRQGNVEAAHQQLQQALQVPGLDTPALQRLGAEIALQADQPMQALEQLRPMLKANPGDRRVVELLLACWQRLGREEEARADLDDVLAEQPQLPHLWLARLAPEGFGSPGAIAVADRWIEAMPEFVPALEARLRLHEAAGEADAVEALAARIVALEPGRISGETRLVGALLARDPAAAVAHVQGVVDAVPESRRRELRTWLGEVQDQAGQPREALRTWLELHAEQNAERLPLPPQAKAPPSWPDLGEVDAESAASAPIFLWGAPGSGVERVAVTFAGASPVMRSDRFAPTPPDDAFQNYFTLQKLASGDLSPEGLVSGWRDTLRQRGVQNDTVIDWLLWWDNALLWSLRPHLPQGRLLVVLRDPRDMLLDWIAYGAPAPFAVNNVAEVAEWLARSMAQVATLHEQDLYPHMLMRMDDVGDDPRVVAGMLQELFNTSIPPAERIGPPRFPAGHWRRYTDVMSAAFDLLTPVAVRLGYPEA